MAWTVAGNEDANHPPEVVVNGDGGIEPLEVSLGEHEALRLDATGSTDPDDDALEFRFIRYPEAGYDGQIPPPDFVIDPTGRGQAEVRVASRCAPAWFEVTALGQDR